MGISVLQILLRESLKMLKELLGELYTDEIAKKLGDAKLVVDDGKMVPYDRFKQVNDDLKGANGIIADRDKQLETLKGAAGDNETLKAEIVKLQGENSTAKTDYDNKLKAQQLDYAIETKLAKEGAVNSKAVRALLDSSKISLDGENVLGLDDQLKSIKETEAWAFTQTQTKVPGSGGNPPPAGDDKPAPTGSVAF